MNILLQITVDVKLPCWLLTLPYHYLFVVILT